ncbi:serine/threonine-protein kinase [Streptomyces sp. NPDC002588]|uniref:serine/threonine-protein kinase n=1 Tax=Streptomyces sp. NPDC002588 TaxID=3154419 RepID=UPI003320EB69
MERERRSGTAGVPEWTVSGYRGIRELGSGASGRVVLARHEETGTPVAVKYLSERLRDDERFRAGFRAEARLLSTLESPYVVRLYEYAETPQGAAIVMELVDGVPLGALLREEGATGPEAALTVLKGSLLGLAAAHAAGVVHRDYKPDNVLVAADGSSKLVDFGIAVRSGYRAEEVAGTPLYMAPEQWTGRPASPVSDVYAATATFFECLTGARPYSGTTAIELAVQHMEAPIPDELVPEPVRPLIRRGLAKDPEQRPATAADFVTELEALATAAYGEDWEERGQRKLAALAALLPLLFPLYEPGASGTTALATTTLGAGAEVRGRRPLRGRGKIVAGVTAGAVLTGALTLTAIASGDPSDHRAGSRTTAGASSGAGSASSTESTGPAGSTPSGTVSGSADASGSASPSTSADASASASASEEAGAGGTTGGSASGATGGTPTGSSGGGGTGGSTTGGGTTGGGTTGGGTTGGGTTAGGGGTPTADPTATAAPQLDVESVTIQASGPLGSGCAMVVSVTVKTDGAADGTMTLTWFNSMTDGQTGPADGTQSVTLAKGQTQISGRYTHTFGTPDPYPYLGVKVSTSPAADSGNGSIATIAAPSSCDPVR